MSGWHEAIHRGTRDSDSLNETMGASAPCNAIRASIDASGSAMRAVVSSRLSGGREACDDDPASSLFDGARMNIYRVLIASLVIGLSACSAPRVTGGPDAGTDAGVDAGVDGGLESGIDAGIDAGLDTSDAGTEDGSLSGVCDGALSEAVQHDFDAGMVLVPAGVFWRGCNSSVDTHCRTDESPGRCITLSQFEIDETEVTQGAYELYFTRGNAGVGATPGCYWAGSPPVTHSGWSATATPEMPITCVSWTQAAGYCSWIGKRLPTEAEWEKAARGTHGQVYPWGNADPDLQPEPCDYANYSVGTSPCIGYPVPVGTTPLDISPYGAKDMAANVYEMTADWFQFNYYANAPSVDPPGPASPVAAAAGHALHGGSYTDDSTFIRPSSRLFAESNANTNPNLGFRCAVSTTVSAEDLDAGGR